MDCTLGDDGESCYFKLHQITWDDHASLLEKTVAYEAVHQISNILDLKKDWE
ncbi:hypothetical protein Bca52824_046901 [Brassica carinata]|uniref:Malonyl-CoA decarboxylase C-terminal domain-containing protein n=1 Tax=Brassica carinata TaxID=52824 RepID=A0A8X7UQP2_BRACI|nr:hypothetical protein Bca52824_046901 [Brassica carinata]